MAKYELTFRRFKDERFDESCHLIPGCWQRCSRVFEVLEGQDIVLRVLKILKEHGISEISIATINTNQISCCQISKPTVTITKRISDPYVIIEGNVLARCADPNEVHELVDNLELDSTVKVFIAHIGIPDVIASYIEEKYHPEFIAVRDVDGYRIAYSNNPDVKVGTVLPYTLYNFYDPSA